MNVFPATFIYIYATESFNRPASGPFWPGSIDLGSKTYGLGSNSDSITYGLSLHKCLNPSRPHFSL